MLLVVGGHSRNIGKSSVVAGLIRALPEAGWTAVKISRHGHSARSPRSFVLVKQTLADRTDSGRYLAAGAKLSYWLQAAPGTLEQALPELRQILRGSENTIVESNSILEFVKPDLYLVVLDFAVTDFKQSSIRYLDRAGAFVTLREGSAAPAWKPAAEQWFAKRPRFPVVPPGYISPQLVRFVRRKLSS